MALKPDGPSGCTVGHTALSDSDVKGWTIEPPSAFHPGVRTYALLLLLN